LRKTFSEKIGKNLKINIIHKNISILSPQNMGVYQFLEISPENNGENQGGFF